jgi:hypothetical protein
LESCAPFHGNFENTVAMATVLIIYLFGAKFIPSENAFKQWQMNKSECPQI